MARETNCEYLDAARAGREWCDEIGLDFQERHYSTLLDIMEEDVFVNHLTLNDEMKDVLHSLNEGFATLRPTLTRA